MIIETLSRSNRFALHDINHVLAKCIKKVLDNEPNKEKGSLGIFWQQVALSFKIEKPSENHRMALTD